MAARKAPKISEHILRRDYVERQMSLEKIASKYKTSHQNVKNLLIEYGIPIRGPGRQKGKPYLSIPKDELYTLYVVDQVPSLDIARIFGVGRTTILKYLDLYGIEKRKPFATTTAHIVRPPKEELIQKYHHEFMSMEDMGLFYNVSHHTIRKWFDHYHIEARRAGTIWKAKMLQLKKRMEEEGIDTNLFDFPDEEDVITDTRARRTKRVYDVADNPEDDAEELDAEGTERS